MAKLKLTRATRHSVALSNGDTLELRALSGMDFSELTKKFDLETVELTAKLINHAQTGKPWSDILTDASIYVDVVNALPDLICNAINLCAGGDDEDLEAIRELPAEDIAILTSKLVGISLERIGGLGNLMAMLQQMLGAATTAIEAEIAKKLPDNAETAS